jgi:tetratricopeptide (TPR) repeat protein
VVQVAKDMADRGELAAAKAKLDAIPDDSPLKEKVPELLEDLKKRIPKRVEDAKAAMENKSYDAASQAVTDITAIDPNNADAAQLVKDIEKAGRPPPKIIRPPPKVEDPTNKAMDAFAAGQLDQAVGLASACDDAKCKALKDKLTAFRDAYANLDGSGNLEKAMSLIKTIPGGSSSPYMQRISAMGSGTFVKEGLAAMSGNNYPKAFSAFSKAQGVDPGNEVVKRNLGIIYGKAKELSEQAYIDMQQDPDKARREFEQILQMTAESDPLHEKAKKRLKKISGGSGD